MKIKFSLVLLSLFFAFVVGISLVSAAAYDTSCDPTIKIVNQDPVPAIPDSYVKVIFEVSNFVNCNGFAVNLEPEYPFSLDPGYDSVQTIENSPYSPDYRSVWDVPYKIRIASDALEGDYDLKMLYHKGSSTDFSAYAIEKDFNVTISDVQTDFDVVVQEVSGTQVSLGIVNTGKNTANSLVVGIPTQDNFRVTGTNQQIVGNLAAGDYTIVSFSVTSAASVASMNARNSSRAAIGRNFTFSGNISQLPSQLLKVQIDYTDGIGARRNVTKEIQFNNLVQGNFTGARTSGQSGRTSASSGASTTNWWYVIIVVVLVVGGAIVYRKYGERMTDSYQKDATRIEKKISKNVPDWVSAERTHRKK